MSSGVCGRYKFLRIFFYNDRNQSSGAQTQNKHFIQYTEYVQSDTGHSSAGFGRTSSLLNHRGSLVWLAMMARSMKGPEGKEERRTELLFSCYKTKKANTDGTVRQDNIKEM